MEAIPLRFRQRIIELYDQGLQTRHIAEMLGTCRSGTRSIRQYLRERGTLEPAKPRGGYTSGLTERISQQLRTLVPPDPDATRQEISQRCRKKIEELFGWAKTIGGLARTRLIGH